MKICISEIDNVKDALGENMIRFIYLLICFSCSNFTAQMLNNEESIFETPFFNEKYIRSINLKSMPEPSLQKRIRIY